MKQSFKVVLEILAIWVISMFIIGFNSLAVGSVKSFLSYAPFHFRSMAIVLVRFVHKQIIAEGLGLQNWRYLSLTLLIVVSLARNFFSGIVEESALFAVVLAPIPKEFFSEATCWGDWEIKNNQS